MWHSLPIWLTRRRTAPADDELVADGEGAEVDAARGQVLGEGARAERDGRRPAEPLLLRLDVLDREERDLAMAEILVGVALDPAPGDELDATRRAVLICPFLRLVLTETIVPALPAAAVMPVSGRPRSCRRS